MKFRYKTYGSILRPVIPITIRNGTRETDYSVLIDSGADFCLFHEQIGESVGIAIREGTPREVTGVGGKSTVYFRHSIEIMIGKYSHKIEAGFMPTITGRMMQYGLVGQRGFFEHFIVKFDLAEEEIELRQRKDV